MRSAWRIIDQNGRLELHRGDSRFPYKTWPWSEAWKAQLVVEVLNIVQTEIV